MNEETKKRIEYEHQFFGYSSDSLIDSFKETLTKICESAVNGAVKSLRKTLGPAAADAAKLDEGLQAFADALNADYEKGVEYAFSKNDTENKIRDCFHIPDSIVLPEDQIVQTVEHVDETAVDQELADLEQELINLKIRIEEAKEEEALADVTIEVLEQTLATPINPLPKLPALPKGL